MTRAFLGSVNTRSKSASVKDRNDATTGKRPMNLCRTPISDQPSQWPFKHSRAKSDSLWNETKVLQVLGLNELEQVGLLNVSNRDRKVLTSATTGKPSGKADAASVHSTRYDLVESDERTRQDEQDVGRVSIWTARDQTRACGSQEANINSPTR